MAAAHVSGAAALIWTLDPGLDHLGVKAKILDNANSFIAADKEKKPDFEGDVLTEGRLRAAANADFGDAKDPTYRIRPIGLPLTVALSTWIADSSGSETTSASNEAPMMLTALTPTAWRICPGQRWKTKTASMTAWNSFRLTSARMIPVTMTRWMLPLRSAIRLPVAMAEIILMGSFCTSMHSSISTRMATGMTCLLVREPATHRSTCLFRRSKGPAQTSVINPLPDNKLVIDPNLWDATATKTSKRIELYFYSPPKADVDEDYKIHTRFRLEYDDKEDFPAAPNHKYLGTYSDYSLFGEVEDHVVECVIDPCAPDYEDWIDAGRPYCWCFDTQCQGDADGKTEGGGILGTYHVGTIDVGVLAGAWLVKEPTKGPGIAKTCLPGTFIAQ